MTNLRNYVFQNLALPSRILSYSKIVKGENIAKTKKRMFICMGFAELPPILLKDSKRRVQ